MKRRKPSKRSYPARYADTGNTPNLKETHMFLFFVWFWFFHNSAIGFLHTAVEGVGKLPLFLGGLVLAFAAAFIMSISRKRDDFTKGSLIFAALLALLSGVLSGLFLAWYYAVLIPSAEVGVTALAVWIRHIKK